MSTAFEFPSTPRLLTVADLAALPSELPSGPVEFELDNGRLIVVSPPGKRHGKLQARSAKFLIEAEEAGLGEAFAEVGIVLWRNPDRVVGADAAFVAAAQGASRETPEGYLETIPALVVEVRSRNDSQTTVRLKAEDYLTAGVQVVWIIDPQSETVTVYRQRAQPQLLRKGDMLSEAGLIPGINLSLDDLFRP